MRAVRIHQFGGPEVLSLDELPLPEPGPGEVRVRVAASGVNFIDIYQRTGLYQGALPLTLGQEAAGLVDALGPGVTGLAVGDRVAYAIVQGSHAEFALVPAAKLVPVPEAVTLEQAAAVLLQGLTAHYLSHSTYPLGPTDTALIYAAAGGTGRLLVQLAKRRGARVLAVVSTPAKAELACAAGADEVLLYPHADLAAEVRRLTGGRGVDVVYDSVGQATYEHSLNSVRPRGYVVFFGQSSGRVPPIDPLTLNTKGSLFITRPTLGHYLADAAELSQRASDLLGWLTAGQLDVRIDSTYPLPDLAAAQARLASRQSAGKLLLLP